VGRAQSRSRSAVTAMMTSQGVGLIAELIGTALLVVALTGFSIRRSQPWLVGVAVAMTILVVAVTIVVEASTWT
jgi:hypothetical protein